MPEKMKFDPNCLDRECDGWNDLACAILTQAASDFRTTMEQQLTGKVTADSCDMICSVEAFFRSDLCCSILQGEPDVLLFTLMSEMHEKHIDNWRKLAIGIVDMTIKHYRDAVVNQLMHPGNNVPRATVVHWEAFIHSKWFHFLSRCDPDELLEDVFFEMIDQQDDLLNLASQDVKKTKQSLYRATLNHKTDPGLARLLDKVQAIQDFMHTEWFKWLETI